MSTLSDKIIQDLERHNQIMTGIDKCERRLDAIRDEISKGRPMKYAMESLPELIGDFQFRMLVDALGLDDELDYTRRTRPSDVGGHFASAVAHKAQVARRRRSQEATRGSIFDSIDEIEKTNPRTAALLREDKAAVEDFNAFAAKAMADHEASGDLA